MLRLLALDRPDLPALHSAHKPDFTPFFSSAKNFRERRSAAIVSTLRAGQCSDDLALTKESVGSCMAS